MGLRRHDVYGNKRVDELAKLCSTTPFIGAEPVLHCESSITEGYSGSCQILGNGAHQLVHSWPPACPNKKLPSKFLALNRAEIRLVTRMLILHNGLNDHMCRIGRHPILLSSRCREGCETPLASL